MFGGAGGLLADDGVVADSALEHVTVAVAIGQIQAATGRVFVTRPNGTVAWVKACDPVYRGDVIETAADGAVSIIFSDDTEFRLSASSRMGLDGFVDGTSNSALFSLTQGAFAFIAGKLLAKTGGLRIDTPLGSIRARGSGLGILTLTALTLSAIEEAQAGPPLPPHDTWQDDDTVEVASRYDVTTKDGRTYQVKPGQELVVDAIGSASVNVIPLAQNADLSFRTLDLLSQAGTFLQQLQLQGQRADATATGGAGSASAFALALPSDTLAAVAIQANNSGTSSSTTSHLDTTPLILATPPIPPQAIPLPTPPIPPQAIPLPTPPIPPQAIPLPTPPIPPQAIPLPTPPIPPPISATIAIAGIRVSSMDQADITIAGKNIVNASAARTGFVITGAESGGTGPVTVQILNSQGSVVSAFIAQAQVGGNFVVNVPPAQAQTLPDGSYTVTATVMNAAGDPVTSSLLLKVATTLPRVTISDAVDGDGNNVINHAEAQTGVGLSGSVSGLAAGSVLHIQ